MILAIDVGNTNIVIGSIDNGEIRNVVRIHTDTRETEAEYTIKLKEIFYATAWTPPPSTLRSSRPSSRP